MPGLPLRTCKVCPTLVRWRLSEIVNLTSRFAWGHLS